MKVVPRRYVAALAPHLRSGRKLVLLIVRAVSRWLKGGFGKFLVSSFRKLLKLLSFLKIVITSIRNFFRYMSSQGGLHGDAAVLPDSSSPKLHLSHPTDEENVSIWMLTSNSWKGALTIPQYLEESSYLTTVPLAKDGGMTQWVLVDKTLPPNQRQLLASCETFRKRSLISDPSGNVTETITHGVASVYCDPKYRRRGYASRLLNDLGEVLPGWQVEQNKPVVASVLFSDVGKKFYATVGWNPFPSYHIDFDPAVVEYPGAARIVAEKIDRYCQDDEELCRQAMAQPNTCGKTRYMILPDRDHIVWHHRKEEFACQKLFGKTPRAKGAVSGAPGNRVWAIWSHRFYGPPEVKTSGNTLYLLRLVIENQIPLEKALEAGTLFDTKALVRPPIEELKAVLQTAQNEAAEWGLQQVKLWTPSPLIERLIKETGIKHQREDRKSMGICSLRWYGEGNGREDGLDWIGDGFYYYC